MPHPSVSRTGVLIALSLCVVLLGCALVVPQVAWPHAILVESDPRHGVVLDRAPQTAVLRFNATLERSVTRVHLKGMGPSQVALPTGDSAVDRVVVELPPLGPGVYTLVYTVLARDGHVTEGFVRFTVRDQ